MNAPYYIYPDVVALKSATGEERQRLCRRIAASVDDPAVLRTLFGFDPAEFRSFYPDMLPADVSTEEAIDSFIGMYGKERGAERDELQPTPPAIDYAAGYLAEDDADPYAPQDSTAAAIDSFLKAVPPKVPSPHKRNTALSESLARIMIKNRNYSKALEIITELSLNNPKKSIYFADRIRFLKKLIANENKS